MKYNKLPRNQDQKPPNAPPQHQPNFRQHIPVLEAAASFRRHNIEMLVASGYQVDAAEDGSHFNKIASIW